MLNKTEERIISTFLSNLDDFERETMTLVWNDESKVVALFDTCFEDDNEYDMGDELYEEFISFAFTVLTSDGEPPIYITEDSGFIINYHNFPDEIFVDGKKIN